MITRVVEVSTSEASVSAIGEAAALIQAGELVAFPTETVYGLGADALNPEAVARIFTAKGRPSHNPLIVHVDGIEMAKSVVAEWPRRAQLLAERFWPGPLTLVLQKAEGVPDIVTGGGSTVGLRVPAHPIARRLISAAQRPIAAPSANRSTGVSPTRAAHVLSSLDGLIPLILDGGATSRGIESTVVDLTSQTLTILRPGVISAAQIEDAIGEQVDCHSREVNAVPRAPGQMLRHYSPRAQVRLVASHGAKIVGKLIEDGRSIGWMTFDPLDVLQATHLTRFTMPKDPDQYATVLYETLHALDDAAVEEIVIELPPDTEPWLAIRDRLQRAAGVT